MNFQDLARLNFNVTGIDPNPDMIEVAKKHQNDNPELTGKSLQYVATIFSSEFKNFQICDLNFFFNF